MTDIFVLEIQIAHYYLGWTGFQWEIVWCESQHLWRGG